MKNQHFKHVLELTFATFLISTSGALGRYIDMPAPVTIWWRSILAMLILLGYCKYKNIKLNILSKKDLGGFIIASIFMALHWITYFIALQKSSVAIGMLSLFTFPIITALLEPLFSKTKFDIMHLILGAMVLLGIYILSPEIDFENDAFIGIFFGLVSALCYALRILIMKQYVTTYHGSHLMFYQLLIMGIMLSPVLIFLDSSNMVTQYPYVIILALVTTALGHTLFVQSLNHFKVSTASIIGSTQPIFGIIIAYFFLNEIPTWNTFFGGLLILSTVIIESLRTRKK
ncbi:DMT family transporter [Mesoflavibacter zeaxanthinifaciens]|uniref:DMT family transporter n=1 Tax=Mesoflavibacter zeaxanthinifaciens TaxID=393060 RepID=UPI000405A7CA|nr:DMT family transporter [Mesoflavibacter zeaxanthinifaciens]